MTDMAEQLARDISEHYGSQKWYEYASDYRAICVEKAAKLIESGWTNPTLRTGDLRELTGNDGSPIYVNPQHVASVCSCTSEFGRHPDWDGALTNVYALQPDGGWIVRGTVEDVLRAFGMCP